MSYWPPAQWTKKEFFEILEYTAAVGTVGASIWIASVKGDDKTLPTVLAGAAGVVAASSKFAAKRLEATEKAAQKAADEQERADLRARYGAQARRMMCGILEELRRGFFKGEADGELYKHRVTLFIADAGDSASQEGRHLTIFARAGRHAGSCRRWPIDDNNPGQCRGVAGRVWFHGEMEIVTTNFTWVDDDRPAQEQYARDLKMTWDEADQLQVKSRAFAGAPVEVNGDRKGVLLVDSLKVDQIAALRTSRAKKVLLNNYTALVSRVLTKMEAEK